MTLLSAYLIKVFSAIWFQKELFSSLILKSKWSSFRHCFEISVKKLFLNASRTLFKKSKLTSLKKSAEKTFLRTVWKASFEIFNQNFFFIFKNCSHKQKLKFRISLHKILFATRVEIKLFSHSCEKSFISSLVSKIPN